MLIWSDKELYFCYKFWPRSFAKSKEQCVWILRL